MIKASAFALMSAMAVTSAAQVHPSLPPLPPVAQEAIEVAPTDAGARETLAVYYTPLESTEVSRYVGLGMAYHMAIVYTDAAGVSHGASSGPSNLEARQTPSSALSAILAMASNEPSSFGTLVSDPLNNKAFVKGSLGDYYTQDAHHHEYPHLVVARGKSLSAQWSTILRTYARVGAQHLTYSPISQNSNSLAATALRRAGLNPQFSSQTMFAPGVFTQLPDDTPTS